MDGSPFNAFADEVLAGIRVVQARRRIEAAQASAVDPVRHLRRAVEVFRICRGFAEGHATDSEQLTSMARVLIEQEREGGVVMLLHAMAAVFAGALEEVAPGRVDEALQRVAAMYAAAGGGGS